MRRSLLLVAAVAGLSVAWPLALHTPVAWALAALAIGLAAVLAASERVTAPGRAQGLVATGSFGLAALAIAQRPAEAGSGLVFLVAATLAVLYAQSRANSRGRGATGPPPYGAAVLLGLAVVLVPASVGIPRWAPVLFLCVAGAVALGLRPRIPDVGDLLLGSSARMLVLSFAVIIAVGALFLALPIATTSPIRFVDAAFTSVSATCVTGLIVLDTPVAFTFFGELVILVLIQIGGLGIMAFSTAVSVTLGRRLGVREELIAAEMFGARRDLESALGTVFRVTVVAETLGAVALAPMFLAHGESAGAAAWKAVFYSISAFCNAGFALYSDNLISYQRNPLVLGVIGALIVVGGLGPAVVGGLPRLRKGKGTLHTRLAVVTTVALLLVPAGMMLVLEWSHTLKDLGVFHKLTNALFLSINPRTAGFNAVDIAAITPATWTLMILLMFVGGSPGSTAGGVKTTTFAVVLLAAVAAIRGRGEAEAFGRRIPHRTVYEATAITTVAVLTAMSLFVAIQVTQNISVQHGLFEVISALGTVGLSMGATNRLDDVGKVLIMFAMFAGRVGPLTLFIFLVGRQRLGWRYPLEGVAVG